MLGPATELVYETSAPFVWAVAAGPDGSMFVGTGNEGKVFRIDQQGRGTVFFDAPEMEAHALAAAPNGGLYVATSPDGRIYKVDRDGKETVFFDPDDKYIWSLAVDAKGTLFAGTGEKGVIYKIAADGTGTKFYETKATHAMALAVDRAGNLLVGHRIAGPRAAHRCRGQGLRPARFAVRRDARAALRRQGHAVRVRAQRPAVERRRRAPQPSEDRPPASVDAGRAPVPSVTVEVTSFAVVDTGAAAAAPRPRRHARTGVSPKGRSTASPPTDSGISSGSRETTRPTISRSRKTAR